MNNENVIEVLDSELVLSNEERASVELIVTGQEMQKQGLAIEARGCYRLYMSQELSSGRPSKGEEARLPKILETLGMSEVEFRAKRQTGEFLENGAVDGGISSEDLVNTLGFEKSKMLFAPIGESIREEVLSDVMSGKVPTVKELKEKLKKVSPEVRETVSESVQNVVKAAAEVYEEEFYGMTREELDADMEQRLKEHEELYKDAEATKIAAKKENKASFIERAMIAKEEMQEINQWIKNAQQFYIEQGFEPPLFKVEGNLSYNVLETVEV